MLIEDLEAARQLIEMQIKDIAHVITKAPYGFEYTFWEDFTAKIIDRIYGNESSQRHGFEQAGRGGCFSVFESYSEHQRREDFIEILNCKKDYLENLIRELENRQRSNAGNQAEESHPDGSRLFNDLDALLNSEEVSPLDRTIAEILSGIQDPAVLQEARQHLLELREELLTASPSWSRMKKPMVWLIEFGKKEFFAILPFIAVYIRKISD
ncbi:hypothetical protein Psch_00369 [Pelotomaculum schinkii]|uniref:Uncharacterized protein n=1 Tax=Pelotomaculum schinkii TaxID=78350 RepID=A0A4Y7RDD0_9FIRM|nr:hypothetical protein [Pelotomaculum schinkii]TEB06836.1 hypothetical protein Psch_00369 [Pelotomaculum schinkii]